MSRQMPLLVFADLNALSLFSFQVLFYYDNKHIRLVCVCWNELN